LLGRIEERHQLERNGNEMGVTRLPRLLAG
jgi:hypothetical protein